MQLPLDLALPPRWGRDDFLTAEANAGALAAIERWPDWPDRMLLLIGPRGAGKSHLGAIWAAQARAQPLRAQNLAAADWAAALGPTLLLDDADRLAVPDAVFFHLLNVVRERRLSLLMTATTPPGQWNRATPDLVSRLRLAPVATLGAPDDALLAAVLVKLFADRQLVVDDSVIAFLVLRLARSLGEARSVVEALDGASLSLGRRITRPMAAQVLDALSLDAEGG